MIFMSGRLHAAGINRETRNNRDTRENPHEELP